MKKYIKNLFALLLMAGSGLTSWGKAVDVNTAQLTGSNFLISVGVSGVKSTSDISIAYTATSVVKGSVVNDYYVFNVNGTKGFVIVSGDDNVIPILAYSNESAFDVNHISPGTQDWLNGYKNQIAAVIKNNVPAKAGTTARWSELQTAASHTAGDRVTSTTAVAPLVATTWDQDEGGSTPYNGLCPNTASTGGQAVTGCVATAMSQIMKFWNWPTVGCGSHTYYDDSSHATLTADYGNTAYQWSSMLPTSSNASVATLMYDAGVSVNMAYESGNFPHDGSGSYVTMMEVPGPVNCAEYALKTYFHYKSSLKGVVRYGLYCGCTASGYYVGTDGEYYNGAINIDSIAESSWISMLQTELSAGRPMLYEGQGPVGGHCWVCDGWETTGNMFHFNWGWSGASDGYYTVDNLAPPALGVGGGEGNFNQSQGVVMGIQPDSFPSNPGNIKLLAHLNTTTSTPMEYGTPFTLTTKILNSGTTAFNGAFSVQVYDTSNTLIATIDSLTGETVAVGDSTATLTFSCNSYALIPELYNGIRIAYKATGSSSWVPVANNGSFINYTILGVLNDSSIVLYDSLHVGSHTILPGSALTVSTTIGNAGSSNFSGTIQAVLINTGTGASFTIQQHTSESIPSGNQNTFTFTNSDVSVTPGLYALEIQHQFGGAGSYFTTSSDYYINPILITVKNTAVASSVTNVNAASDMYVYPNPANDVVNILMEGLDVTAVRMMDVQGRVVKTLTPGTHALIAVPVTDLAAGVYFVEAQTTTGVITKKVIIAK